MASALWIKKKVNFNFVLHVIILSLINSCEEKWEDYFSQSTSIIFIFLEPTPCWVTWPCDLIAVIRKSLSILPTIYRRFAFGVVVTLLPCTIQEIRGSRGAIFSHSMLHLHWECQRVFSFDITRKIRPSSLPPPRNLCPIQDPTLKYPTLKNYLHVKLQMRATFSWLKRTVTPEPQCLDLMSLPE